MAYLPILAIVNFPLPTILPRIGRIGHNKGMAIILKSEREIDALRRAGRLVAATFAHLDEYIRPGASTMEIDRRAEEFIRRHGAKPMYKGYKPPGHSAFPATICVAINNVIVHSFPHKGETLKEGDIVGIDIGVVLDGWVGDGCKTYTVGAVAPDAARIVAAADHCLTLGIEQACPGNRMGDIGAAIQSYAEAQGYSVVRELCGHGVGRSLWEPPNVFHYGVRGKGVPIREGMVFTIEPMINQGHPGIRTLPDGWTIVTADGSLSAQFEHTLAITPHGTEILTRAE
jgi:methionyl aminopeptidase